MLKKEWKWFSVLDFEKEAAYLSKMHAEGWKFVKLVWPGRYTFESCEPQIVTYRILPAQEERKGEEKIFSINGYDYYRSEADSAPGLLSERMDCLKKVFTCRVLPLLFTTAYLMFLTQVIEMPGVILYPVSGLLLASLTVLVYLTIRYVTMKKELQKEPQEETNANV